MLSILRRRVTDFYYNCKFGFRNLWTYRKLIWNHRPWDFDHHILKTLKFQLERLRHEMDTGYEVRESLDLKLKDIDRALELIDNFIKDEFIERVGGLTPRPLYEYKELDGTDFFELVETRSKQERDHDHNIIDKANALEDEEWKELWGIIANGKFYDYGARAWWD